MNSQQINGHSTDFTTSMFRRFQDQVHQWYPILHSDFTPQFIDSNAAGFPCSTISCLSLLVAAIASLVDDRPHSSHYEAALSMIPIAMQEYSITSVQCLVLFSIYFSCLLQPRQAYDYIQAAFLKIQPFLKRYAIICSRKTTPSISIANLAYVNGISHLSFSEGSPESPLVTRLYWTIHLIMRSAPPRFRLLSELTSTQ
jgi:hypothetical protein